MKEKNILQSLLEPQTNKYRMSEQLFLDVWREWGNPEEINEGIKIYEFISELINRSDGLFILDHFSHINYDYVKSVSYEKPFLKITWKDLNYFREKHLNGELTEDDDLIWGIHSYNTYSYMLLNVNKIKFVQIKNHLFILFLTNFIPEKLSKNYLLNNNELISEKNNRELLYRKYTFLEGDKNLLIKHDCIVNNLPYYSCLIQPKENGGNTGFSRDLLLLETLKEIRSRMNKVYKSLVITDEYDYDELFSVGNKIRRILEYCLKSLCIYKDLNMEIDTKYGHIKLGELRKEIIRNYNELNFEQSLINIANELSHDSGAVLEKQDVIQFWEDVKVLTDKVNNIILSKN